MKQIFYTAIAVVMCLGCRTFAQVLVSGGTYVQNFDALTNNGAANWTNNFTLLGWYASKGNADATNFTLSAGTSTAGGIYSFAANGINSSADRALGSLGASSTTYAFGVRFTNNTAAVVTNLLISYVGEQWRSGSTTTPQTLAFAYQISSSPITNTYSASGWINFPALNFVTPNLSAAASPLDGNAATNRVLFVNVALTNLAVGPGQEIFLRWLDVDDAGFDNAVAIDDLTVSFGTNTAPVGTPPFIITQPQSQTVAAGDNVTFTVTVTGMAPFSFQWQSNNVIIPHATNSTFTLNSVTTNFTGSSYFVTVTNEVGATNSQTATLTVNAALVPTASANTNGDITLMTYNLAGNGATNWSTNAVQVQAIGRQLLYLQPDVVTFNEIPHNYLYEMTNWVTAFLPGYNLVVSSGTDGFIHSGIATRFPMARSQKWLDGVDLNPFGYTNANYTRDLFEVEVAVPNWPLPLHVFTTHLKSSASGYTDAAAKRAAEAAAVTNFFATNFFVLYPNHPFTLSGDMNEGDTNTTAIQELLSAPMTLRLTRPTNSVTGSINTYTIRGSVSERIDYIFPCAFLASNIVGGQVFRTDLLTNLPPNLFANDDKDASDHLPVLLTFANPFNTPFKLLAVARTNQSVTLQWESQKNRTFRIEASTNLVNWFAFTTNLLTTTTNSPYVFTTNNVSDRIKFFRIYRVP